MYRRFAVALVAALATLTACGTNSPMAASDSFAPIAKTTGGGVVPTPTRQFVFVWGSISINGVPAPAGTVVSAVDRVGNMAGQFTVWYLFCWIMKIAKWLGSRIGISKLCL